MMDYLLTCCGKLTYCLIESKDGVIRPCIVLKKLTLFIFCQTVTGKHNLLFLKIFRKEKFYL